MNNITFRMYYDRLIEIALSRYEWYNKPDSLDERFLELCLCSEGKAILFEDDVLGYLGLRAIVQGDFNVYSISKQRRAIAVNGYNKELTDKNSVLVFNNYLRTPSVRDIEAFAKRLYNIDRAIDVNVNAQKTPVLIQCEESQRLTMKNLYMKYEGNEPFIFGDNNLNPNGLKVLQTGAPFIADRLYDLRHKLWCEALTFLGVYNVGNEKKERMVTGEVDKTQGGVLANRFSGLAMRKKACDEFNKMFSQNMGCRYRNIDVESLENEV